VWHLVTQIVNKCRYEYCTLFFLICFLNYLVRMKCIYLGILRQYLVRELFKY